MEVNPGTWIEKEYDLILLRKGRVAPVPPYEIELKSSRTWVPEIGKEVIIEETHHNKDEVQDLFGLRYMALLDFDRLEPPLKLRNFRPGDRFQPLGVKGTQKLKEFFIDHKIPRFERDKVPLLISGGKIAWVVGHRIDDRVKVTDETKKILKVSLV